MKTTQYFRLIKQRKDRAFIKEKWIAKVVYLPEFEMIQNNNRISRWSKIEEFDNRFLRVILLEDGETIHNCFFDRNFKG